MGFFNTCWEALLQIASWKYETSQQQPLLGDHHGGLHDSRPSTGVSFTVPGANFTCHYPTMKDYTACNSEKNRRCWLKKGNRVEYDIETPYDMPGDEFTPDGIEREYWLEVDLKAIAPDGYLKELGQVFNGSYPGPHLQACWGDTFVVHVTNKIPNLGTTIHWHGIRQLNSTQQDGVNGVTQCPIAYNETYTYRFRAEQYGHTWYHSHYQTQYSDGVAGPLTIYGPSSDNWDETFYPLMMQDWVHDNTSNAFRQELAQGIPISDGLLLNGTGTYKCSNLDPKCCSTCGRGDCTAPDLDQDFCCHPKDQCFVNGTRLSGGRFRKVFQEGKKYLLQLINASADAMFIFSIDDHEMTVIAADLVPIHPYKTDSVFVAIGQRYQVIIEAKPKRKRLECKQDTINCNYWIRTRVANGCGNVAQSSEETGIISYSPLAGPRNINPLTESTVDKEDCADESPSNLRPIVEWNVTTLQNSRDEYTFDAAFNQNATHGAFRWDLADYPLWLNYSNPSILNIDNSAHFTTDNYSAIVNYTNPSWNNGFVYLVITGSLIKNIPGKVAPPAAHPIHLHGHDFLILSQQNSAWNGSIPANQLLNPTRRDTALLYAGGYLALAFKLDNPGVWLVHCHIAWHASSGLALQIIERQDEIEGAIGDLGPTRDTCAGWERMGLSFHQEDSGI